MGSVVSQEVYDVLEEDPSQSPKSNLRTLPRELDPRSPTVGVDRTPIQFAATPVQLIDPRSPSFGIERTPIYPLDNSDGSSVDLMSVEDCDQPTRAALVLPFNLMDAEEYPVTTGATEALVPVPVPVAPIIDLSDALPPQRMDFQEVQEHPMLTSSNTEITPEFLPPTVKAPCNFQKVKPLRLSIPPKLSASPRSPLGARNVDSGSLRSMVQLREARKMESMWNSKSPADSLRLRNNSSSVDKENL